MSKIKLHDSYISVAYQEKPLNKTQSIRHALNSREISRLMDSLKDVELSDGIVGDKDVTHEIRSNVRMCKIYWIPRNKEYLWLYKKIVELALKENERLWGFDLVGVDIPIQYTEYDESYSGHYDWHVDIGNTNNSKRKLSISLQLSEDSDYTGGDLKFFNKGKACRDKGSMTIFPSYMLHKVEPVTKGNRKCLVLWLTGHPFK